MRSSVLSILAIIICSACTRTLHAQPVLTEQEYTYGYDIPSGDVHGTWDFDEWPGIDHDVVYKKRFQYNTTSNDRYKINYEKTIFDDDDHKGYLRSPQELLAHGFIDMSGYLRSMENNTLVGVFAHPDDDVLLAGGLFAYAKAHGWNVTILLVSNGADGSKGYSDAIPVDLEGYNCFGLFSDGNEKAVTDLKGLQKSHMIEEYASIIGLTIRIVPVQIKINGKQVVQLGEYPGLDWPQSFGPDSKARQAMRASIDSILHRIKPSIVITHGRDGEYGNYLHKTVYSVTAASVKAMPETPAFLTAFPEYNQQDQITHFLDLDKENKAYREKKFQTFRALTFLHQPGLDYDKPWDPTDDLMDGAFVKDYGYSPIEGYPPRYEYFQLLLPGSK